MSGVDSISLPKGEAPALSLGPSASTTVDSYVPSRPSRCIRVLPGELHADRGQLADDDGLTKVSSASRGHLGQAQETSCRRPVESAPNAASGAYDGMFALVFYEDGGAMQGVILNGEPPLTQQP